MRYPVWSEEFVFPPLSFLFGAVCHSEERQATFLSGYPPTSPPPPPPPTVDAKL